MDYIQNLTKATLESLKKKKMIFIDQVTSLDGTYLLPYKEVKKINSTQFKGPIPKWFTTLENQAITSNQNRRLLTPLSKTPIQILFHNTPKISSSNKYYRPKNQWTVSWNPELNVPIYGKTIEQVNNHGFLSITYSAHYVVHLHQTETANNTTPRKRTAILKPCNGCNLHMPYYRDL
jgi:hypothetical protein